MRRRERDARARRKGYLRGYRQGVYDMWPQDDVGGRWSDTRWHGWLDGRSWASDLMAGEQIRTRLREQRLKPGGVVPKMQTIHHTSRELLLPIAPGASKRIMEEIVETIRRDRDAGARPL